jgi:hypothetical protein
VILEHPIPILGGMGHVLPFLRLAGCASTTIVAIAIRTYLGHV